MASAGQDVTWVRRRPRLFGRPAQRICMCGLLPSLATSFAFAPLFDVAALCNKQKSSKIRPMGAAVLARIPSTATPHPCVPAPPVLHTETRGDRAPPRAPRSRSRLPEFLSSMTYTAPCTALCASAPAAPAACSTCYLPRYCCWWWWWWWWWCYCDGCCSWAGAGPRPSCRP